MSATNNVILGHDVLEFYTLTLDTELLSVKPEEGNNGIISYLGVRVSEADLLNLQKRSFEDSILAKCQSLREIGWRVNIILQTWKRRKYLAIVVWRRTTDSTRDKVYVPSFLIPARVDHGMLMQDNEDYILLPNRFFKKNRLLFTSAGVNRILSALSGRALEEDHEELPDLNFLSTENSSPYILTSRANKYFLNQGRALRVRGNKKSLKEYYAHILQSYEGRVLWIGELPEDRRYDQFHTIDYDSLRFNLIGNFKDIDNSPLIDFLSNIVESVAKIKITPGIFRSILSEISGRGVLKNKPFSERIYNVRDNKESHGTRDEFGQLVSVLFDTFNSLQVLDSKDGRDPIEELRWKRTNLPKLGRFDTYLALGFLMFFAKKRGMEYDLVIINDQLLTHLMTRSTYRDRYPPILEQLLGISSGSRFVMASKVVGTEPTLDLGAKFVKDAILIVDGKEFAITVDNSMNGNFTPYVPEQVKEVEVILPITEVDEYANDFDRFYKSVIQGRREENIMREDSDEFFRRLETESKIIKILLDMRGCNTIQELDYIETGEYSMVVGEMKQRGLLTSVAEGFTKNSKLDYLTTAGEKYVEERKMEVVRFYRQFETPYSEIRDYIDKLDFGMVTGHEEEEYMVDTSNIFLHIHSATYAHIVTDQEVSPLALALSSLWSPTLYFKDPITANGRFTSNTFRILTVYPNDEIDEEDVYPNLDFIEVEDRGTEMDKVVPGDVSTSEDHRKIFDEFEEEIVEEVLTEELTSDEIDEHMDENSVNNSDKISILTVEEEAEPLSEFNFIEVKPDEKSHWNFLRNLPGVELSEKAVDLKRNILRLPLFRIAKGPLANRLFFKASNLTLGDFQQLKDQLDFRREIGLSTSQVKQLYEFDLAKTGLNVASLVPSLDEYARYMLVLLGCHLKPEHMPNNVIRLMSKDECTKITGMIDSTEHHMNFILPLVDKLFLEWGRMLVNKTDISAKLSDKVGILKTRLNTWKSERRTISILNLKNYALINNIIMLFQEVFGGLYSERVKEEQVIAQIPDSVLRDEILRSERVHHIITFSLGHIYRMQRGFQGNIRDDEKENLREEVKLMVPNIILQKY